MRERPTERNNYVWLRRLEARRKKNNQYCRHQSPNRSIERGTPGMTRPVHAVYHPATARSTPAREPPSDRPRATGRGGS